MASEKRHLPQVTTIKEATGLLNSLLKTAKIDIKVIEFILCKEEVVIASPQVEDYDKELTTVEKRDDIEERARYLAAATIATKARQVQTYIRFYLTSGGKLRIEECLGDSVIVQPEEDDRLGRWKGAIDNAVHWAPAIIRIILMFLRHIQ